MRMKLMKMNIYLIMKNIGTRTQKKMKKLMMNIQKNHLPNNMIIWNEKEFEDNILLPGNMKTEPYNNKPKNWKENPRRNEWLFQKYQVKYHMNTLK